MLLVPSSAFLLGCLIAEVFEDPAGGTEDGLRGRGGFLKSPAFLVTQLLQVFPENNESKTESIVKPLGARP